MAKMDELSRGCMKNPYIRLTCVNMLVFAIELAVSAGFSYLPPLLLKAGFGEVAMTWIMGVGSFVALLTVPFLGSWSDNCSSPWGRRTPFMLAISFILIAALIFISLGHLLPTFNVFLLVTGAVLLNYSCQAGLNPCEALVADMTARTTHQQLGFTIYSVMISFGGCIGYLITAINWSNTPLHWLFLSSERTAFAFVLVLLLFSLAVTLAVAVEKPHRRKSSNKSLDNPYFSSDTVLNHDDVGYESDGCVIQENLKIRKSVCEQSAVPPTDRCPFTLTQAVRRLHPKKMLHKMYCQAFRCCRLNLKKMTILWNGPTRFVKNCALGCRQLIMVPPVMRLLFIADLCSWTALMCQLMYYTDYVGQKVYGGNPNAEDGTVTRELYDDGVRMGSFGLFLHSVFSIVYACTIQKYILRRYGCRAVYLLGLFFYTITMIITLLSNNIILLNVMATLSGTGFAAITTVPYMLISEYHAQPQIYFSDHICSKDLVVVTSSEENAGTDLMAEESSSDVSGEEEEEDEDGGKHSRGFGTDIAVMDAAYFLSQTLLSLFIGSVVDLTSVTAYISIAAIFGALSCYCTTKVVFPPHV